MKKLSLMLAALGFTASIALATTGSEPVNFKSEGTYTRMLTDTVPSKKTPYPKPLPTPAPLPNPAPNPNPLPTPLPVPSPNPNPMPSPVPSPNPSPTPTPTPAPPTHGTS